MTSLTNTSITHYKDNPSPFVALYLSCEHQGALLVMSFILCWRCQCVCGGSQNIPKVVIVWSVKKDLINIGRFMVKPHNKLVRESGTRDVKDMR